MRAFSGILCVALVFACGACRKGAPAAGANQSNAVNAGAASTSSASNANGAGGVGAGENLDTSKLDAEIARLEQQAEKNPEDDAALDELANAYVRRGDALREAHRLADALRDYQSALKFSPDHEDASLRVAQVTQEIGAEPHAEDGKPVSVPAKPGENENK